MLCAKKMMLALFLSLTFGDIAIAQNNEIVWFYKKRRYEGFYSFLYRGLPNCIHLQLDQKMTISEKGLKYEISDGEIKRMNGEICIYPGNKDSLLLKVMYGGKLLMERLFQVRNAPPPIVYISKDSTGKTAVDLSQQVPLADKLYLIGRFHGIFENAFPGAVVRITDATVLKERAGSPNNQMKTDGSVIDLKTLGLKSGDKVRVIVHTLQKSGDLPLESINLDHLQFSFTIK